MSTTLLLKNWLKIGLTTALLVIFATAFSGCRTKCQEGSAGYPECLGEDAPAATNTNTPKEKPKVVELVFWNLYDPNDTFSGQIQAFQSQNSNVRIVYKKFENEEEYEQLLINEIAEGEGPDIFAIHHSWVPKHQGKISPMPVDVMVPDIYRETFFDVTGEVLIREDEEGFEQIYGIPLFVDTLALYYNKSIFRDGIQSTSKPDDTWEGIKEQVFTLTETNNSAERFALSGIGIGRADNVRHAIDVMSLLLIQNETQVYDETFSQSIINNKQGTVEGTGKAFYPGRESLKLYTSFALPSYKHYSWNQMITGYQPEQQEIGVFLRGKTAMIFGYSSLYQELLAVLEGKRRNQEETIRVDDIGVAEVPQFMPKTEKGQKDALANFYPLTVSRNSEDAAIAWEFLHFLASAEGAKEYHQKTNKPTARFDLIDDQVSEDIFGAFARQVPYSKTLTTLDQDDFSVIISEAINSVAKAKSDSEDAMALVETRLSCIAKKFQGEEADADCTNVE